MANISFNEMMDKLSGKFEGLKTTVQEGKLMSGSLQEVIDKTLRKSSERIRRCAEEKNALDKEKFNIDKSIINNAQIAGSAILDNWAPEHRANDPILDKILEYYDYEPAKKLSGCNEVIGVGVGIGVSSCRQWKGEELISISQDETKEIDIDPGCDIHHDFVCFKRTKISHQDIANSGVKVDDLDNYPMLVRDLVEEKPNSCDVQEKEETQWYSRMAPMEATFGVKFLNRYKGEQNNGN